MNKSNSQVSLYLGDCLEIMPNIPSGSIDMILCEFPVDSLAVYMEVDSFVPTEIAPFLTKAGHEPKEFEGVYSIGYIQRLFIFLTLIDFTS